MMRHGGRWLTVVLWLAAIPAGAHLLDATPLQSEKKALLDQVGFDQHLDAQLPLDTAFVDQAGRKVSLRNFFVSKPVILLFGYYNCKNLCDTIFDSLIATMNDVRLKAGADYQVVNVSINPDETAADAQKRLKEFRKHFAGGDSAEGWHLLTGQEQAIREVADTAGFRYSYDPKLKEYLHASGIVIATGGGKISKYFYGLGYNPTDVRLGLVDASQNQIGTPVDQLLLRCFHYDPVTGKYSLVIMEVLRLLGIVTIAAVSGTISVLLLLDQRARRQARQQKLGANG